MVCGWSKRSYLLCVGADLLCLYVSAQEASWKRGFDPVYLLLFNLNHSLRTKVLSDFHPFEGLGVNIRWFSVDGFDTHWIARSFHAVMCMCVCVCMCVYPIEYTVS